MKKRNQEIFWWTILGIPLIFSLIALLLGLFTSAMCLLGTAVFLTAACWIMSHTEHGPATQLPNNTVLRVKAGRGNFVGYYVNAVKRSINSLGKVRKDDGKYQKQLRSGLSGLVFRKTGMVYTGILPGINGVEGIYVSQTRLDYKKATDGSGTVSVTVEEIPEMSGYHIAIPLFIHRGWDYGGIPIKGKNLINIGIRTTLVIDDVNEFTTKFSREDIDLNMDAIKGTFESSLRPMIEKKGFEEVLEMKSEYHDTKGKKISKKDRETSPVLRAIDQTNVASTKTHRYGVAIDDIDIPLIAPADTEYAEAERKEFLEKAKARANTVKFKNRAKEISTLGKAKGEALAAQTEASGDPTTFLISKGMKGLKPHVVYAPGMAGGAMLPLQPVAPNPQGEGEWPKEKRKKEKEQTQ